MIVVTGAAGFIGSCLVGKLNGFGLNNLILVDEFTRKDKEPNLYKKKYVQRVDRALFHEWLSENHKKVNFIFHLGARTDTTEFDHKVFERLNLNYSMAIWQLCTRYEIPLVYASSAATYGNGELGYDDSHDLVEKLKPLNPYGESKNDFDKWVISQNDQPPYWAGLKFFNVFGPNEYHKGRMASVVMHAHNQINRSDKMILFRSHKEGYKDGEQLRDFVYVKDVTSVCMFLMLTKRQPGIFNLGTGKARSFIDLTNATFAAMGKNPRIEFIDTPEDIRDKYQYFTQANMSKLMSAGYEGRFHSLEDGVSDYVINYLSGKTYL